MLFHYNPKVVQNVSRHSRGVEIKSLCTCSAHLYLLVKAIAAPIEDKDIQALQVVNYSMYTWFVTIKRGKNK